MPGEYATIRYQSENATMKNERTANEALADYNEKEYTVRQQWAKVLAAPAKPVQRKPVVKRGFFSKLFKVI